MGNMYVNNASVFLIQTLFGFALLIIMLRTMLQMVRADFHNPVSQFIVKVSNPLIIPLRRLIPSIGGLDTASLLLLLVLQCLELLLIGLVANFSFTPLGLVMQAIAGLLSLLLKIYIFGILIQVILSWVSPGNYNPVTGILYQINEPLLRPARRLLPPISGFDLSPIIVMIALQLMTMLVLAPFADFARSF
ncbi:MAG: YggT family protein [Gammaproteobacteria bacterium]|nr:YggT family protein [Gammaproteobacteria bacterium]MDH5727858.1 YggT family protein [Gammaproteobacteria bacterium]